jgi:hypothetical protein
MVVTVCAVGVTVGHFFVAGGAHVQDLDREVQGLTGQGVVAV